MKKLVTSVLMFAFLVSLVSPVLAGYPEDYGCGNDAVSTKCYVSDDMVNSVRAAVTPPLTRGGTVSSWDLQDNMAMVKHGKYWVIDLGYKMAVGDMILWVVDLGNENYLPQKARKFMNQSHYAPNGQPGNGANFNNPVMGDLPF